MNEIEKHLNKHCLYQTNSVEYFAITINIESLKLKNKKNFHALKAILEKQNKNATFSIKFSSIST